MATGARRRTDRSRTSGRLTADQGLIALFIGALEANDRTTADEAARAHHLIWSTHRFRRRSGETVGRLIEDMRRRAGGPDTAGLLARAARAIPRRQRASAYALLADLLLADGRLDRGERAFLAGIGEALGLERRRREQIVEVVLIKNQL
jgi:tellurite resistance protein